MNSTSKKKSSKSAKMSLAIFAVVGVSSLALLSGISMATESTGDSAYSDLLGGKGDAQEVGAMWSNAIKVKTHARGNVQEVAESDLLLNKLAGAAPFKVTFEADKRLGAIGKYSWNFGDGDVANGSIASHVFRYEGVYTITLVAEETTGNVITEQVTVTVTGQ